MSYKLHQKDACKFLRELDDGTVDLIVTDPPYEPLEKHRAKGTTTRLKVSKSSSNKWFDIFPNSRFHELLAEIYRVLGDNSHFYIFCDSETSFHLVPIAESVGFKFWKPIIWDKVNIGMGDLSPQINPMTKMRFPINLSPRRPQNEETLYRRTNHQKAISKLPRFGKVFLNPNMPRINSKLLIFFRIFIVRQADRFAFTKVINQSFKSAQLSD